MSWTNPGSVSSAERTPPPAVASASNTVTCRPACASTIAAASPFGPDPMTMASGVWATCLLGSYRDVITRIGVLSEPAFPPDAAAGGRRGYWYSRWLFERALALIYLVAFLVALNQFVPLLGEHGLLPVPAWVAQVPVPRVAEPLLSVPHRHRVPRGRVARRRALGRAALPVSPAAPAAGRRAAVWAALWLLYLSFVNVGQTFYGFGWETLLLETGFLAIFLGGRSTDPGAVMIWLLRWLLFRLMFGAGLIKLRGDPCWRDLTCLDYYFETQPMPNPLSWYFHWLPRAVHHAGVVINHIVELGVPFAVLRAAAGRRDRRADHDRVSAHADRQRQLSWLNWLTIVLAFRRLHDRWLAVAAGAAARAAAADRALVGRRSTRSRRRRCC